MTESAAIGLPMCVPEPSQARAEVRRFFAGVGVAEGPALERLVERVMTRCQALRGVAPTSVAAWLLAGWVGGALQRVPGGRESGQDWGAAMTASVARAAVLLTAAGQRWPGYLLADGPLPEALSEALRGALPQPVPRPLPLAMPEQPLAPAAFGMPRLVGSVFGGLGAEQRS